MSEGEAGERVRGGSEGGGQATQQIKDRTLRLRYVFKMTIETFWAYSWCSITHAKKIKLISLMDTLINVYKESQVRKIMKI